MADAPAGGYTSVCVFIYIYIYTHIYIYVYMYVCMYVLIYKHTWVMHLQMDIFVSLSTAAPTGAKIGSDEPMYVNTWLGVVKRYFMYR